MSWNKGKLNSNVMMSVTVILCVATSSVLECAEAAAQQVSIQEIETAWRNREARFQSIDVTWDVETVTVENEAELQGGAFGPTKQQVQELGNIKREVRDTYKQRLILAGEKIRYEDNQQVFYAPTHSYVEHRSIAVFDGVGGKNLTKLVVPNVFEHQGTIGPAPERGQDIRQDAHLRPLVLNFLPFFALPKIKSGFAVTPDVGIIDGVECIILRRISATAHPRIESLWLDPRRFLVLRETVEENTIVSRQLDITYADDPSWGPLPKRWNYAFYDHGGALKHSITGSVEEISVNTRLSSSAFDIVFPENTLVTDATRVDAKGGYTQYVVKADNRERIVLPEEFRRAKTDKEIIETETGRAGFPTRNQRPSVWISVGVLALALVGLIAFRFFYYRRGEG